MKGMIHHDLCDIVVIVFLATMCGCEAWTEFENFGNCHKKWLSKFLKLPGGIPSHDTFERVFSMLDLLQLEKAITSFIITTMDKIKKMVEKTLPQECEFYQQYSVDGKELRGSGRNALSDKDEKTNEIPVAQEILATLNLKHTIISFHAMNTQRTTVKVIRNQKGDYIGGLKENQPLFYDEAKRAFDEVTLEKYSKSKKHYVRTSEKAHSCIETREYYMMDNLTWFCNLMRRIEEHCFMYQH